MPINASMLRLAALVIAMTAGTAFAQSTPPAAAAASAPAYKYQTPKLNRAQLDRLLGTPDKLVIIDVRRPDELTRIGGFPVYLSVQAKELEKSLAFIPKGRTLVTVSNHAGRAGAAGDLLRSKGFTVAGAVGAQDYEAEGGTLVKVTPPAPKASADSTPAGTAAPLAQVKP